MFSVKILQMVTVPGKVESSLYSGTPDYSSKEDAESKSLIIGVVGTYMKVISPHYNHDPKPKGWGVICKTIFFLIFACNFLAFFTTV